MQRQCTENKQAARYTTTTYRLSARGSMRKKRNFGRARTVCHTAVRSDRSLSCDAKKKSIEPESAINHRGDNAREQIVFHRSAASAKNLLCNPYSVFAAVLRGDALFRRLRADGVHDATVATAVTGSGVLACVCVCVCVVRAEQRKKAHKKIVKICERATNEQTPSAIRNESERNRENDNTYRDQSWLSSSMTSYQVLLIVCALLNS